MAEIRVNNIEEEIILIISKVLEIEPRNITEDAQLINDLGADSMMILEIMIALDKKFKIEIPEAEIPRLATLKQISLIVNQIYQLKNEIL